MSSRRGSLACLFAVVALVGCKAKPSGPPQIWVCAEAPAGQTEHGATFELAGQTSSGALCVVVPKTALTAGATGSLRFQTPCGEKRTPLAVTGGRWGEGTKLATGQVVEASYRFEMPVASTRATTVTALRADPAFTGTVEVAGETHRFARGALTGSGRDGTVVNHAAMGNAYIRDAECGGSLRINGREVPIPTRTATEKERLPPGTSQVPALLFVAAKPDACFSFVSQGYGDSGGRSSQRLEGKEVHWLPSVGAVSHWFVPLPDSVKVRLGQHSAGLSSLNYCDR